MLNHNRIIDNERLHMTIPGKFHSTNFIRIQQFLRNFPMNINCFQQSIIFQNVNEIMKYKRRRIEFVPVRMKWRKIAHYLFSDYSSTEYAEMKLLPCFLYTPFNWNLKRKTKRGYLLRFTNDRSNWVCYMLKCCGHTYNLSNWFVFCCVY